MGKKFLDVGGKHVPELKSDLTRRHGLNVIFIKQLNNDSSANPIQQQLGGLPTSVSFKPVFATMVCVISRLPQILPKFEQ